MARDAESVSLIRDALIDESRNSSTVVDGAEDMRPEIIEQALNVLAQSLAPRIGETPPFVNIGMMEALSTRVKKGAIIVKKSELAGDDSCSVTIQNTEQKRQTSTFLTFNHGRLTGKISESRSAGVTKKLKIAILTSTADGAINELRQTSIRDGREVSVDIWRRVRIIGGLEPLSGISRSYIEIPGNGVSLKGDLQTVVIPDIWLDGNAFSEAMLYGPIQPLYERYQAAMRQIGSAREVLEKTEQY